ncbi:MAG: HD domain-containing protein [Lachnospiraceae bacterium]|nr:HD domain-containing protein [Lachnospiraceae bacterium]
MNRVDKIRSHSLYLQMKDRLEELEKDRIFCIHNEEHSFDVARIAYIMNLEQNLGQEKELIYAMAFLHDLGRVKEYEEGLDHHVMSAKIAEEILRDCDFTMEECVKIKEAISLHRRKACPDTENVLCRLLYTADKASRNCKFCKAKDACYWSQEEKNQKVTY